jgi:hypothetical protein
MANLATSAILTAIREVIEDGTGSVRTITSGDYLPGETSARSIPGLSRDALIAPRAEVRLVETTRSEASPAITGSFQLLALDLEIRLVRSLTTFKLLDHDARQAVHALAALDGDVLAQALTWPGNLTQTAAAAATGLVSGCLRTDWRSAVGTVEADGSDLGRLITIHRFTAIAQVALATS